MMLAVARSGILLPGQVRPCAPSQFAGGSGLLGYWGFDADCIDFSNSQAIDISGNGNSGSLAGISGLSQGQVGNALTFNGTSSTVTLSPVSVAIGNSDLSISCWLNTVSSTRGIIYGQGSLVSVTPFLVLDINEVGLIGKLCFRSRDNVGNTTPILGSAASINDGFWHHCVATQSGVSPNLTRTLYVDGQQTAQATGLTYTTTPVGFTSIGAVKNGTSNFILFLNGVLDDVRVYGNRALAPWEVIQLYQAGLAGRRDGGNALSLINNAMVI